MVLDNINLSQTALHFRSSAVDMKYGVCRAKVIPTVRASVRALPVRNECEIYAQTSVSNAVHPWL